MRKIKQIHRAENAPIADLITYRAFPTRSIDHIDPFLLLNHHGHQVYSRNNNGLPFGPHPHRGFETVTFIVNGDLTHQDSSGAESVIRAGGVQWMTAGKGLIHNEISSKEFMEKGGDLEILQLWVNLPSGLKMADPAYLGKQEQDIPKITLNDGKGRLHAVSGNWEGTKGAFSPMVDIHLATLRLQEEGGYTVSIAAERNILFYVVSGNLKVNGQDAQMHDVVEFGNEGEKVEIKALSDSLVIIGHALPFNEPIVAQGPFVMNTREEIVQAYHDYQAGTFGSWSA